MYLEHYQLDAKPFEMSPDPRFLWMGEKHKEALAALEYGILESKGFLLLTGDVGTGKTVLINSLLKSTRVKAVVATMPDPDLDILDFFNVLAEEFQMNKTFETKGTFLIEFKHFLHDVYQSEGKVLLIIDESQRLNHELLEQIRILSNIELDDRKLINIFFVGQSEFNQILREERNAAVRKRLAVCYNLEPLDRKETEQYIDHRLKVAGAAQNLFTPEALRDIFYFTGGYPRLINITCDHALLTGYAKELKQIDETVIAVCRKDLRIISDTDNMPQKDDQFGDEQQTCQIPEEDDRLEQGRETDEPDEPFEEDAQGGKRIWWYVCFIMAVVVIGYFIYSSWWSHSLRDDIKESPPAVKSGSSKGGNLQPQAAGKGEGNGKIVSGDNQMQTTAPQEPLAETGKQPALSANQDDGQRADPTTPENISAFIQNKTIVEFDYDSMRLSEDAREILDRIVKFSLANPVSKIVVEGYTDSLGDYLYNKDLSKSRADVIKEYLVGGGISETKIETVGRGPENPIADNKTSEGRKLNRRIEISVKVDSLIR